MRFKILIINCDENCYRLESNAPLVPEVLNPVFFGNDNRFVFWIEYDRTLTRSLIFVDFLQSTAGCS